MVRTSNSRSKTGAPAGGDGAARARGPRADRRWRERQREILRAAAAVFREKGFAAAGMRDIAEQAGLSAANLYYYYGSKDELLFSCQDLALERLLAGVQAAREGDGGAPERAASGPRGADAESLDGRPIAPARPASGSRRTHHTDGPVGARLRALIEGHLRCVLEELEGGAAHLAVDALPPALRAKIVRKRDRYERGLRDLVAEGVAAGEFAPCDPTLVTRAMLGALNWTAQWYRAGGRTPLDALCAGFADYLVRGLRP